VGASNHAVVWIDHDEAKVYRFNGQQESEADIHSHVSVQRLHHRRAHGEESAAAPRDAEFFERITRALDHAGGTVITGPGKTKLTFKSYLDQHSPQIASRIFAVDSLDRPVAAALLALGRQYFKR
jgi:stalled ribosome rescue protein Dom34